jgi:NADPH-dependent curcumin reductase CurA
MWRKWVLAARPAGVPGAEHFRMETAALPDPQDGEIVIAVDYVSIDPGMRSRLSKDSYAPALALGSVIESAGLGTVVASRNPKFAEGQRVTGGFGWQSHVVSTGRGVLRLDPSHYDAKVPMTAAIGVLGIPGLTAYFGLLDLGAPKPGETVLISSAAGTVGATAGQIAKIEGLTAIGIAGGQDKCDYVRSLGFDACLDYKDASDLAAAIARAAPKGVDIYFDNVGAKTLDAAISRMNAKGRIVVSGQIAEYNAENPRGIRNTLDFIPKRLRMEGLVVFDYAARFAEAQLRLAGWIREGKLAFHETVIPGLEAAPGAFAGLFAGNALGRALVKVSPD